MDRKIEQKKWKIKRTMVYVFSAMIALLLVYRVLSGKNTSHVQVDVSKISISKVNKGIFQEYIPVVGVVMPGKSNFLDAIQSGTISQICKESGALLKKGDTVMVLTNSNLQLNVMSQELQLYEQMNHLRNTKLSLDQNILNQQTTIVEIEYQLQLLIPKYCRYQQLYAKKLISDREFEDVSEQFKYNLKKKSMMQSSFKKDSLSRAIQMKQLVLSGKRMEGSLGEVRNILNDLIIRSPVDGQLATPELQLGQAISNGQRLGQVDRMDGYKVRVGIDEHYLPRISLTQKGAFDFNGSNYQLSIGKIYPTIANGKFEVDMEFIERLPEGLKRGQSFHIRLELGNSATSLLLPMGGFYLNTGGNWVFVVDHLGKSALKKNIRIGRKNPEFLEVIEGLSPGDQVITSSYQNMGDSQEIQLK